MKLLHLSDTHGCFSHIPTDLTGYDCIVHSGDIAPNFEVSGYLPKGLWIDGEINAQKCWYQRHEDYWRSFIGDRPFLYVLGNHDYFDPGPLFRSWGLDTYNLHHEWHVIDGIRFGGFHFINVIGGNIWQQELSEHNMTGMVQKLLEQDILLRGIDVLVTHAPLAGLLDEGYGIKELGPMFNRLGSYKPRLLCHGHIHQTFGEANYKGVHISNAATGWRELEL
jgi:Icc-related predicted phosphoesterase